MPTGCFTHALHTLALRYVRPQSHYGASKLKKGCTMPLKIPDACYLYSRSTQCCALNAWPMLVGDVSVADVIHRCFTERQQQLCMLQEGIETND